MLHARVDRADPVLLPAADAPHAAARRAARRAARGRGGRPPLPGAADHAEQAAGEARVARARQVQEERQGHVHAAHPGTCVVALELPELRYSVKKKER